MMRLPWFEYRAPKTLAEATRILAGEGSDAMLIAGGTDLLPNMKRRQMAPKVLVSLTGVSELRKNGSAYGAGLTLTQIVNSKAPTALRQAAHQVATVHLRNMGTLGGNLCLDTRCNYYNQNYEWRKAIDFCLKKDGDICWVATASKRCVAASSTDCAPALIALGASVRLVSSGTEREIHVEDLFNNDGIDYLKRRPDEILTEVRIPETSRSTYWKLRRRGAFDFPVLGVAAATDSAGNTKNCPGCSRVTPVSGGESERVPERQEADRRGDRRGGEARRHARQADGQRRPRSLLAQGRRGRLCALRAPRAARRRHARNPPEDRDGYRRPVSRS